MASGQMAMRADGEPVLWGCKCKITEDDLRKQHQGGRRRCIQSVSQRLCPACAAQGAVYMHENDFAGREAAAARASAAEAEWNRLSMEEKNERIRLFRDSELELALRHGFSDVAARISSGDDLFDAWLA